MTGLPALVAALLAAPGLTDSDRRGLAAYLLFAAAGATPPATAPTLRRYRNLAADLGLAGVALDELPDLAGAPAVRLDYTSGLLVVG